MLTYRLGTVNDFQWEFKPVLSYSKPHTFSTFFGKEKGRKNAFTLSNHISSILKYKIFIKRFISLFRKFMFHCSMFY